MFLKELLAITESGNIFYSPLSIYAITLNASVGANSKTFDEIIKVINSNETTDLQNVYGIFLEKLTVSVFFL